MRMGKRGFNYVFLSVMLIILVSGSVSAFWPFDNWFSKPQPQLSPATRACTDTDGGINQNVRGVVSWAYRKKSGSREDKCSNNGRVLIESYCNRRNRLKTKRIRCTCENGACISTAASPTPAPAPSTPATNARLSNVRGYFDGINPQCNAVQGWVCNPKIPKSIWSVRVELTYPDGSKKVVSGVANKQREAAVGGQCGGNSNHGFTINLPQPMYKGTVVKVIGVGGLGTKELSYSPKTATCGQTFGSVQAPSANPPSVSVDTCTDTDGGINTNVSGTVTWATKTGKTGSDTDYCMGPVVREFYCTNSHKREMRQKHCTGDSTCKNGACVSMASTLAPNEKCRVYAVCKNDKGESSFTFTYPNCKKTFRILREWLKVHGGSSNSQVCNRLK